VASWSDRRSDVPVAWCVMDPGAREVRSLVERIDHAVARSTGFQGGLDTAVDGATTADPADALARAAGYAALLVDSLETERVGPLVLVLDDLHELHGAEAAMRVVESLIRGASTDLHVIATSRQPITFQIERLRGQGQVVEIRSDDLAFDRAETMALLRQLRPSAEVLVDDVLRLTRGWPALTRLILETLRTAPVGERPTVLARSQGPDGPLLAYIAQEVLGRESAQTLEVLRIASRFESVSPDLLVAVGIPDAAAVLESLAKRALLVEQRIDGQDRGYVLHALVRDYALANLPLGEDERQRVHAAAADRLHAAGRGPEALQQRMLAGQMQIVVARLEEHGFDLARGAGIDVVVDAIRSIPVDDRTRVVETVLGDALLRRGEWDGAVAALRRAAPDPGPLPAAVAWRLGFIQHERGDVGSALDTFDRADMTNGAASDLAQVAAWRTIALWQREDVEDARTWAARAAAVAGETDDARAMAAVLAATGAVAHMDGDGAASIDAFRRAIAFAEQAGDLLLEIRFRTDLGYNMVFQGRYAEALFELDQAVSRGGALGNSTVLGLALSDRGQAHVGLGRFEEAAADFGAARRLYDLIGSAWAAYPTVKEADVQRMRGDAILARQAYRDVIAMSNTLSRPWFLPEAILGLAAVTVDDDVDAALRLVDDAMRRASSVMNAATPLAAARVYLVAGRSAEAADLARHSQAIAEARRDRASLAGAMDVLAAVERDRDRALDILRDSEAIWIETGSRYGLATHGLVQAGVVGGQEGRAMALDAAEAFRRMGARRIADRAGDLADRLGEAAVPTVSIRSLGAFMVFREGMPVSVSAWRSKKARDLLKVLVARRGRPATRDQLCEILWPDEDPGPLLNRLSVALATIRAVLDPDRALPPDHFIRADKSAVALDLDHMSVDIERFLADATEAARRRRDGRAIDRPLVAELERIEAMYRGEFLEEDPYEAWAEPLRDEALATYLDIARALAAQARAADDADTAVRLYLRILERDPYDEMAHLGVVETLARVGRHGEARRRYQVYCARMADLDLEAASYPGAGRPTPPAGNAALSPA
jgi:ATP/maltotriose-dependent transcriptional regulator MalT/DNA-binding SARP family transcriptional activator